MKMKFISCALATCLCLGSVASASNSSFSSPLDSSFNGVSTSVDNFIDRDTAATVAMIFVANSVENDSGMESWGPSTTIRDIITLYDTNNLVNAYCIQLLTSDKNTGYVIVSANSATVLITEFSDSGDPSFVTSTQSNKPSSYSIDAADDKLYYVAPTIYLDDNALNISPVNTDNAGDSFIKSDENVQANNGILALIADKGPLNSQDWIDHIDRSAQTRGNTQGSWISDPVAYLKNVYGINYTNWYYNNDLEGKLPAWTQGSDMNCSIHMLAGLAYVNRASISSDISNLSLNQIYSKFLAYAKDTSYYTESNGVEFYNIQALGNYILDKLESTWSCDCKYVNVWTQCESEIDAGRAVGVNIASGYYYNHSVVGYAYTMFQGSNGDYKRFIKIRDGWSTSNRYIECSSIDFSSITVIS